MTQTDTNEISEGASLTKAEFCRAERISPTYLHQLWREGTRPAMSDRTREFMPGNSCPSMKLNSRCRGNKASRGAAGRK
jgi:hypothetical protein